MLKNANSVIIKPINQATLNTIAIALSWVVQNQFKNMFIQVWLFIKGTTISSVIGHIKKAVNGDAICSTLWENQKTLHCLLYGTTFCNIVCSVASMYGCNIIKINNQIVVKTIDEILVKNIHTIHIITFIKSNVLTGFFHTHHLLINNHQTINQKLKNHHINHHISTDTKESQYGSIKDIKTHHKKLLNIEKNISPNNQEIHDITFIVQIKSIFFHHSSFWCEKSSFGKFKNNKWNIQSKLAIIVIIIAHHIHKNQIVNQEKTETIQKAKPFAIHKTPFALSRLLSSKSSVIIVDIVIIRIFHMITQNIIAIISNHKSMLLLFVNISNGKLKNIIAEIIKNNSDTQVDQIITFFFLLWSTTAQKNIQEIRTANKYSHHIKDVTIIDFVSKYTQKTSANHIKLFATEHKIVFHSRWKNSLFFIGVIYSILNIFIYVNFFIDKNKLFLSYLILNFLS